MEKWAWPVIAFFGLALLIGVTAYNDSKNPEAESVSPKNNPVITGESINDPGPDSDTDSDSDSDTRISERDSLLGNDSAQYPYSINNSEGGSRRHRKNNKGSK